MPLPTLRKRGGVWSGRFAGLPEPGSFTTVSTSVRMLSSMKKGETDKQKSFFSARIDHFRLSYARRVKAYRRRCVFAGSTNEKTYLLDPTGNRRFWCVWCDVFDIAGLRRDRDQLWGEAAAKVLAGETCPNCKGIEDRCPEHRWWLDKGQTALAETVAKTRLKTEFAEEIQAWWFDRAKKPAYLQMKTIVVDILGLTIDKKEQHQQAIGRAMISLGFERKQIDVTGGRAWAYLPSDALKMAPPPGPRLVGERRDELLSSIAAATAPKDRQ